MACHDPRDYVLGQDLRVRILTTGPQTSGRHDLVDALQLPDTLTPLHLHTRHRHATAPAHPAPSPPAAITLNLRVALR